MSDEELRNLGRRALIDPSALLPYAIALYRHGQLVPSFPDFPFHTFTKTFLQALSDEISPPPSLPPVVIASKHGGYVSFPRNLSGEFNIRPTSQSSLEIFAVNQECPMTTWLLFGPGIRPGHYPNDAAQWGIDSHWHGAHEVELAPRVTDWVEAHSHEMQVAETLAKKHRLNRAVISYYQAIEAANAAQSLVEMCAQEVCRE
jgi:hypothetical protein